MNLLPSPFFLALAPPPDLSKTNLVLTIAIGIIMLGLGLSLTIDDFKRVALFPKAVFIGLFCQMLVLPFACLGIAVFFNLPPELAVGLMLLSASPGGASANLFSHLSHGDVALNVTLTAINSVLSLFTLPLIVGFSVSYFMAVDKQIPIQFSKVVEVFGLVLVPVAIGMTVNHKFPDFSKKLEKGVKIISAVVLFAVVIGAIFKYFDILKDYFGIVAMAALAFNVASLLVGYLVPLLFKIEKPKAIAIGMEIGIHNGTLAMVIASKVLENTTMQIPPAIYSIFMFLTAAAFGYLVNLGQKKSTNA